MTPLEIDRVQSYLRRLFGTEEIRVIAPAKAGLSVELAVAGEIVGTIHKDVDDGETSFALTMMILEDDLPKGPRPALAPTSGKRRP
ncbi:MAG: hypothetical protein B7Z78_00225 [Rhodospirillales bacterium 20-60-12]|jgi:hypothetical protein|nr:MAG: hypothetical protein B7Z78_00225 [Rhodospirillales bacterium 20-60-12]HQT66497.1 DUF3126 family protein [Acetobacteraceae bacterium]